jgi:hypothetical protein
LKECFSLAIRYIFAIGEMERPISWNGMVVHNNLDFLSKSDKKIFLIKKYKKNPTSCGCSHLFGRPLLID